MSFAAENGAQTESVWKCTEGDSTSCPSYDALTSTNKGGGLCVCGEE